MLSEFPLVWRIEFLRSLLNELLLHVRIFKNIDSLKNNKSFKKET